MNTKIAQIGKRQNERKANAVTETETDTDTAGQNSGQPEYNEYNALHKFSLVSKQNEAKRRKGANAETETDSAMFDRVKYSWTELRAT